MKIGYDGYYIDDITSAWGATERNLINNLISIDKEDIFYIFTTMDGSKFIRYSDNARIINIGSQKKRNVISRIRSIRKAINENSLNLDLYIETCEVIPKLNPSVTIFSLVHDFSQGKFESPLSISRFKGILYNYLHIRSIRRSQALFCNSEFTMRQLKKYLQPNQIATVFPHGIDPIFLAEINCPDHLRNILEDKFDLRFFLYVGRVDVKHKNVLTLFQAFKEISITYPSLVLVLATSKKLTKSQLNYIKDNNLRISVVNSPSTEEIACLYKKSIALIFPSMYEGFGIPIIEAQTVGCPVILNDIEVFREVAGEGAIYFNGDYKNLREKMEFFLKKENSNSYVKKGKLNAIRYSWEKTAIVIYKFIRKKNSEDMC